VTLSGPGLQNESITPDANYNGTTYASPTDISGALTASGWQPQETQQVNTLVNSLTNAINEQNGQLQGAQNAYQTAAQTPFTFNQNSPDWQVAQQNARQNANQGMQTVQAQMGSQGIANSNQTAQGMQNIENQDYTQALAQMLPQEQQNQYNQYQGNISNLGNVLNAQEGLSQQNVSNLSGLVSTESGLQSTQATQQLANATLQMNQQRYGAEAANYMTTAAINSVKALGQVTTQQEADLLGVPIGTPSAQATQAFNTLNLDQQKANTTSAKAGASIAKAATKASGTSSGTTTGGSAPKLTAAQQLANSKTDATSKEYTNVAAKYFALVKSTGDPTGNTAYQQLASFIISQAGAYTAEDVDPGAVLAYVKLLHTGG
jgi:hypothetical protein